MKCFADKISEYPVDIKLMFHAARGARATHLIIAINKDTDRKKIIPKWHFYPHECYYITRDKDVTPTDMSLELTACKKVLIAQGNIIIVEHEFDRQKRAMNKPVLSIEDRFKSVAELFKVPLKKVAQDYSAQHSGDLRYYAEFSPHDFKTLDKSGFMTALELEFYGAAIFPHGENSPYISVRISEDSQPWAW